MVITIFIYLYFIRGEGGALKSLHKDDCILWNVNTDPVGEEVSVKELFNGCSPHRGKCRTATS